MAGEFAGRRVGVISGTVGDYAAATSYAMVGHRLSGTDWSPVIEFRILRISAFVNQVAGAAASSLRLTKNDTVMSLPTALQVDFTAGTGRHFLLRNLDDFTLPAESVITSDDTFTLNFVSGSDCTGTYANVIIEVAYAD